MNENCNLELTASNIASTRKRFAWLGGVFTPLPKVLNPEPK